MGMNTQEFNDMLLHHNQRMDQHLQYDSSYFGDKSEDELSHMQRQSKEDISQQVKRAQNDMTQSFKDSDKLGFRMGSKLSANNLKGKIAKMTKKMQSSDINGINESQMKNTFGGSSFDERCDES